MGISKFNKSSGKNIDWGFDSKELGYKKTSEVELEKLYDLKGFFITPDRGYGKGAVLITPDFNLNIPSRYVEDLAAMSADEETVEQIKNGKAGFYVRTFVSKNFNRTGYSIEFVEKQ